VGQGHALPQQQRPQPGAATLDQPLQQTQAPQLTRRPTPISRAHNHSGQDS
jgi:hypothetical protein